MCYTGMCRYENYMGDCCASKEQMRTGCVMAEDYDERCDEDELKDEWEDEDE